MVSVWGFSDLVASDTVLSGVYLTHLDTSLVYFNDLPSVMLPTENLFALQGNFSHTFHNAYHLRKYQVSPFRQALKSSSIGVLYCWLLVPAYLRHLHKHIIFTL